VCSITTLALVDPNTLGQEETVSIEVVAKPCRMGSLAHLWGDRKGCAEL